jgi:hypothetical protein
MRAMVDTHPPGTRCYHCHGTAHQPEERGSPNAIFAPLPRRGGQAAPSGRAVQSLAIRGGWLPNRGLELTAYSVRSCLAPASISNSGLALSVRQNKESKIVQNSAGETVADILKRKKASIKQAPLPSGSPDWDTFMQMTWEHIEEGARANKPGFKVVRKWLTDKRFDK